ncbi:MAG TPA: helix-turn-helix domain-containing protein [Elusimicrobiales bacterium]|nr:helix-turn-helix domain-containing protein [Elusimicrobiales bacterium]
MKALTDAQKKEKGLEFIQAATRVLAQRGFDALTMEEVAREAGVAKGTLFLYYKCKEDLVQAVFATMAETFGGTLRALAASGLAPEELLNRTILALLEHFDKKRDITGYSGGLPLTGPRKEALRALFAANMEALAAVLRLCTGGGLLELADPLFAASALFGLCRGSNSYARAAGRQLPVAERARRIAGIFLNGTRKKR